MNTPTVLIVNDNRFARTVVRAIIHSSFPDFNVIEAKSSAEALHVAHHSTLDWIIVDYDLSDMSGIDLLQSIAQQNPNATMSLIGAFDDPIARSKAHALGVCFIEKPIEENAVLSMFDQV